MKYKQLDLFPHTAQDYDFLLPGLTIAKGDNRRLLELQYEYLTTRSRRAHDELWLFAVEIALKTVNGELARKALHATRDRRKEYAYDAVAYIMRRYEYDTGYTVKTEYLSAIKWAVKHAIYYRSDTQKLEKIALRLACNGVSLYRAFEDAKRIIRKKRRGHGGNRAQIVSVDGNHRDNADNHFSGCSSLFQDGGADHPVSDGENREGSRTQATGS